MNKIKKMLKKAGELDWNVQNENDNEYLFSKFSPAGQDFNIVVDTENDPEMFLHNLYESYSNFDVSYETSLWLDDCGHGKNGAPYDMKDLYEDMEACQEMINSLYIELRDYYDSLR